MVAATPRLTIGLPVYNGERYLGAALESILGQSFDDFELIISDNASADGTPAISRSFAARDPRVQYRRNARNVGLSGNFNLLVPLAHGRLFKWATSDDQLRPGYLEACVAALDADPSVVLAAPKTQFVDGDGAPLDISDPGWHLASDAPWERLRYAVVADQWMNAALGVIRTEALRQTRLMPRYSGGDCRLMAELSVLGKFVEIPDVLYVRRIHATSYAGNASDAPYLRRYMSGSRRGVGMPAWRLRMDYIGIILGAPIPATRKATLLLWLLRAARYKWRRLLDELRELPNG